MESIVKYNRISYIFWVFSILFLYDFFSVTIRVEAWVPGVMWLIKCHVRACIFIHSGTNMFDVTVKRNLIRFQLEWICGNISTSTTSAIRFIAWFYDLLGTCAHSTNNMTILNKFVMNSVLKDFGKEFIFLTS